MNPGFRCFKHQNAGPPVPKPPGLAAGACPFQPTVAHMRPTGSAPLPSNTHVYKRTLTYLHTHIQAHTDTHRHKQTRSTCKHTLSALTHMHLTHTTYTHTHANPPSFPPSLPPSLPHPLSLTLQLAPPQEAPPPDPQPSGPMRGCHVTQMARTRIGTSARQTSTLMRKSRSLLQVRAARGSLHITNCRWGGSRVLWLRGLQGFMA